MGSRGPSEEASDRPRSGSESRVEDVKEGERETGLGRPQIPGVFLRTGESTYSGPGPCADVGGEGPTRPRTVTAGTQGTCLLISLNGPEDVFPPRQADRVSPFPGASRFNRGRHDSERGGEANRDRRRNTGKYLSSEEDFPAAIEPSQKPFVRNPATVDPYQYFILGPRLSLPLSFPFDSFPTFPGPERRARSPRPETVLDVLCREST